MLVLKGGHHETRDKRTPTFLSTLKSEMVQTVSIYLLGSLAFCYTVGRSINFYKDSRESF